jgi:hypothetical protein
MIPVSEDLTRKHTRESKKEEARRKNGVNGVRDMAGKAVRVSG